MHFDIQEMYLSGLEWFVEESLTFWGNADVEAGVLLWLYPEAIESNISNREGRIKTVERAGTQCDRGVEEKLIFEFVSS